MSAQCSYNDHFTVCTLVFHIISIIMCAPVIICEHTFNDIFCSGTNLNDCPLHQRLHFFSTADPMYVLCTLMFENEIIHVATRIYVYEVESLAISQDTYR